MMIFQGAHNIISARKYVAKRVYFSHASLLRHKCLHYADFSASTYRRITLFPAYRKHSYRCHISRKLQHNIRKSELLCKLSL